MNDDNSGKTEDELYCVFIRDQNGDTSEYDTKSPSTGRPSASPEDWNAANPDDMVVDHERDPAVDGSESVSLSHQRVEAIDYPEPSSGFISKPGFALHSDPTHQPSALSTMMPQNMHSKLDSLEAPQAERFEPSLSGVCKSDDGLDCVDSAAPLELKQTFDMKLDATNCTSIARHSIERGQPFHAPGGLSPTSVGGGNTLLSCPMWTSPQPSEMHVRGTHNSEGFEKLRAPPPEALNTTYTVCSDVPMQTDGADLGIPCRESLGNVTKEYPDGPEQGLIGDKEIQAVTPVSDGMEVPSGSVLQEFHCVSEDEPNSETHSHCSYGQQEMGQNLRGTLSNRHVGDECPSLVPAFNKSKTSTLDSECKVTMTEDLHATSHDNSEIQKSAEELTLTSVPGQRFSLCEMAWDGNGRAISTNNTICTSTPVQDTPSVSLTLSPVDATERCNLMEKGPSDSETAPNLKGAPVNAPKPNLGKSATKTNATVSSKVRKTEIISYPRPNFKNIKAKVISRSVLQPKDASAMNGTPKPQITGVSSAPPVPSKQLTAMNRKPRSDLNADKKAEIVINKTDKQQFNKLITSQALHVSTHSKNAPLRVPRTTSAAKSNREDVDKTSASSHAASETGSVAAFFQKIKGILPGKMKSSECLEVTFVSHIDRISPEKGEKDCEAPMEKQELGKPTNETSECKPPFVGSAPKTASTPGRNISKPDPCSLRKATGLKAKVGPAVSCLRRKNDSRILGSDRALSPQRIRRVSGSGGNAVIKYEEKPPKQAFQNGSGSLYLKPLVPRVHAHLLKTPPKGPSRKSLFTAFNSVEKGRQKNPRSLCIQTQTAPDVLSSERALELAQYKTKCENQSGFILHLKQLLSCGNTKFEALTVVIQHLLSEREEALKQHKTLSQELVNLRGELVVASSTCEKLEKARNDLQTAYEGFVQKLNQQHQTDRTELENRLKEFYTAECEKLQNIYIEEAEKYKIQLQEQFDNLNAAHETTKLEIEASHSEKVELLKKSYETSLSEIKKNHEMERKSLENVLNERQESLEKQINDLKSENDALNEKLKSEEQKRVSREKANSKNPQVMYLEQELESLKAVLEIKNEKLHQQDMKLMKMEKLVDNNTALVDKLKRFQQENEELKARMDKHVAISRQLSTEQAALQESLEKESKVNKRLSMENEELLWKLHNGDLCSPKRSPTSAAIPFQSPRNSGSFSSPSISPR